MKKEKTFILSSQHTQIWFEMDIDLNLKLKLQKF